MLKAVYSYSIKRDRFLMLVEQTGDTSFSKTIVPCTDATVQTVEKRRYMREQGFLESHRFCGGSLTSSKYSQEIKQVLGSISGILWCGDEWIAPREVYNSLPSVVLRNGGSETFRPSELGVKPVSVLGGTLGAPDLGFYGD